MTKHTYVGDPKLVVAEKMTITEYKDDYIKRLYIGNEDKYHKRNPQNDESWFYSDHYTQFKGVYLPVNEKGYKVTPDKGDSYWLSENEFESKFFKINNASYLQKAKEFKVKLRTNKSISLKTSNGVERPSLLISNAVLTVISDWAKNGLLEDK